MATRREINSQHEKAVMDAALHAHNQRMGTAFSIETQPDPPDAILVDSGNRTWMEHTDAFYPGWAEDITSYAASDKSHKPMARGLHSDMDEQLAEAFIRVVVKKFGNEAYRPTIEKYGPGILIVGLESPWLDAETLRVINQKWADLGQPDLSSVFSCVYFGYRAGGQNRAELWIGT
ncbi:hypothetical protein [Marinobacter sp.]|uniref:hypothetical protein n=1 Tax=Marinobacter sp. TaxID=50741 RepID=UPI0034A35D65